MIRTRLTIPSAIPGALNIMTAVRVQHQQQQRQQQQPRHMSSSTSVRNRKGERVQYAYRCGSYIARAWLYACNYIAQSQECGSRVLVPETLSTRHTRRLCTHPYVKRTYCIVDISVSAVTGAAAVHASYIARTNSRLSHTHVNSLFLSTAGPLLFARVWVSLAFRHKHIGHIVHVHAVLYATEILGPRVRESLPMGHWGKELAGHSALFPILVCSPRLCPRCSLAGPAKSQVPAAPYSSGTCSIRVFSFLQPPLYLNISGPRFDR